MSAVCLQGVVAARADLFADFAFVEFVFADFANEAAPGALRRMADGGPGESPITALTRTVAAIRPRWPGPPSQNHHNYLSGRSHTASRLPEVRKVDSREDG